MALSWGRGQSGSVSTPSADNNFTVPQTVPNATATGHATNLGQVDAKDAAILARVPAPTLDTAVVHTVGQRRTWTDGLIYVCAVGGAAIGETPVTHPAKWVVWDVDKATVDAIDTRLQAVEGVGAASLPVARQENAYSGGLIAGDRLLVGPVPTAVLSGFANQVATVVNPAVPTFTFAVPFAGQSLFVKGASLADGSGVELSYTGTTWEPSQSSFVPNLTTNDNNSGLAASQGVVLAAADAANFARIDAPTLDVAAAHLAGVRRTWTDGLVYVCQAGGAAIGETPTTHPAKWVTLKHAANLSASSIAGASTSIAPAANLIPLYDPTTRAAIGHASAASLVSAGAGWVNTTDASTLAVGGKYVLQAGHTVTLPVGIDGDAILIAPANGDWVTLGATINAAPAWTVATGQLPIPATSDVANFIANATTSNWVLAVGGSSSPTVVAPIDNAALGYFDNGTMRMQWGTISLAADTNTVFSLPSAFANANYALQLTRSGAGLSSSIGWSAKTVSTFSIDRDDAIAGTDIIDFFAIGLKP
jgi:hypothetical protein